MLAVGLLATRVDGARREILEAIRQAYRIAVTVSEKNEVQARKVAAGDEPLFSTIKVDKWIRIQETAVNPEALLPGGPYNLWREKRRYRDGSRTS